MKVIFFKIDGVLNNADLRVKYYKNYKETGIVTPEIDEDAIKRLADIVKATGAKLVSFDTTWNDGFNFKTQKPAEVDEIDGINPVLTDALAKYGLEISDYTIGYSQYHQRVGNYLWKHKDKDIENFVILYPTTDTGYNISEKVINTAIHTDIGRGIKKVKQIGLQDEHVEKAIQILSGTDDWRKYFTRIHHGSEYNHAQS